MVLDAPTSDGGRIIDIVSDLQIKMNTPKMTVGRDPVIVHRDTHFVIVYKPANIIVPARGRQGEHHIVICSSCYWRRIGSSPIG